MPKRWKMVPFMHTSHTSRKTRQHFVYLSRTNDARCYPSGQGQRERMPNLFRGFRDPLMYISQRHGGCFHPSAHIVSRVSIYLRGKRAEGLSFSGNPNVRKFQPICTNHRVVNIFIHSALIWTKYLIISLRWRRSIWIGPNDVYAIGLRLIKLN